MHLSQRPTTNVIANPHPKPGARLAALAAFISIAWMSGGCGKKVDGGAILPAITIDRVTPEVILPGSRMLIAGSGFVVDDVAALLVVVQGAVGTEVVEFATPPARVDDGLISIHISGPLEQVLIRDEGVFTGTITVLRTPRIEASEDFAKKNVQFRVGRRIAPRLERVVGDELYPMDSLTLRGADFLFDGEGLSLVEFRGVMNTDNPLRSVLVDGLQVPAIIPETDRDELMITLTPDILGIIPGRFEGELRVVNGFNSGDSVASEPLSVSLELKSPSIDGVTPEAASRGAWVRISGRGFMPPDGLLQAAMVLQIEGRFVTREGAIEEYFGTRALMLVPDLFSGNTLMSIVLRAEKTDDGSLVGLGVRPGQFSGTITPLTLLGPDRVRGAPFAFGLSIRPQKQIIYLRALPSFDDALVEFGLLAEKEAVKARILEVCRRDYAGISIDFTWEVPDDFAEYGVVEIAGRDPNGSGLFGLDNTTGKDVGNLRFDDIVGGFNADTSQDGYAAYGGVFPAEFMSLSARAATHPLASPRFDDIFEPVSPQLGGKEAELFESETMDQRGEDIREAVRVFGNLVGSTISHEVGHSLGLAAYDGQFHNPGDNPGWLMDSGTFRPFEERAEIDGFGPSFFGPPSRAYLESILPLD